MAVDQNEGWDFPIQWARGFGEDISFRTEIITSRDGTEQRIAQRTNPRVVYDFESFLNFPAFRRALRLLSKDQARKLNIAHPRHSAEVTVSGTALSFTGTLAWVTPGQHVFLEDGDVRELAQIATAGAGYATVADALSNDFSNGARMVYAVPGYFSGDSEIKAATSRAGLSRVEFKGDPLLNYHEAWSASPVETFVGKELLVLGPQWSTDVKSTFSQAHEVLDFQRGAIEHLATAPLTRRVTRVKYILRDDDQKERLIGLFYRCRGRQKTFFMPAVLDEIRPAGDIASGTATLVVQGREFYDQYNDLSMFRYVRVRAAGQTYIREVLSMEVDGQGDTEVTMTSAWGADIALTSISAIEWVVQARFESDTLSVNWLTDSVAEVSVVFRMMEVGG